jgi:IstB-like ATP binding protein
MGIPVVGLHQGPRNAIPHKSRPDIRSPLFTRLLVESSCHWAPSTYDDWGPETLNADQRRDLLEIIDDRHEMRSIIVTSQVPIDRWYEIIGDPTIADAILDRLVHNAYRIDLTGESLRKMKNPPLTDAPT